MKTLILMRHGQAGFSAETDYERTLTATGEEQALQAGILLKKAGFIPQIILCSPLLRARQSAQLAAQAWGLTPTDARELDGRLSAAGLLHFSQELLSQYDHIMLVGHNPNVSLAAAVLSRNYMSLRPADCAVFDVTDFQSPILLFQELS
jgi:phosphohistidine phosphatase